MGEQVFDTGMAQTWTTPPWCPPIENGPGYDWTISFYCDGEYWSPQSALLGGPPDGVDLAELLRQWFRRRGGPAATWRLQVARRGGDVVASVKQRFDAYRPPVKSLRRNPGVHAPPCWTPGDQA
jgi:hypothetical protein